MDFKQLVRLRVQRFFVRCVDLCLSFPQGGDLTGLTEEQLHTLEEWVVKYQGKYQVVGRLA